MVSGDGDAKVWDGEDDDVSSSALAGEQKRTVVSFILEVQEAITSERILSLFSVVVEGEVNWRTSSLCRLVKALISSDAGRAFFAGGEVCLGPAGP